MTMNREEYMKTGESRERSLPAAWTDVLDSMQRTLAQAAEAAERQEQALETIFVSGEPEATRDEVWQRGLEQLVERLRGLQTSFEKAEAEAASVDNDLAAGASAFQQWLAGAQVTRRKLAKEGDS
jgi:hypothetical protein